jgi:hypothetical protein
MPVLNARGREVHIHPEGLLLRKERKLIREYVVKDDNPCIGCMWENTNNDKYLDFCHHHCKE